MINIPWWVPTYKITSPFDDMALWDHVTIKNHYISTATMSMATRLARMVIYLDLLLIIKSYKTLILWSCKVTWKTKIIISITRMRLATKLGIMTTSLDELQRIMSHDLWSHGLVRYKVHLQEEVQHVNA